MSEPESLPASYTALLGRIAMNNLLMADDQLVLECLVIAELRDEPALSAAMVRADTGLAADSIQVALWRLLMFGIVSRGLRLDDQSVRYFLVLDHAMFDGLTDPNRTRLETSGAA